MNLIQQLADYQNAPIQSLEAAKQGANPNISPWVAGAILSDRLEKQKRMAMEQGAAQGQQPTVSDQQDQEVSGIMQAMAQQSAPQAQPAQQGQPQMQEPVMAAEGGLMQAKMDPGMFDFCGGGIIAFDEGGKAESKDSKKDEATSDVGNFLRAIGEKVGAGWDYLTQQRELNAERMRQYPGALEALTPAEREARMNKAREIGAQQDALRGAAPAQEAPPDLAALYEKAQREGNAAGATTYVPPALRGTPPAAGGAKPAAAGAGGAGGAGAPAASKGVMSLLTNSPEWKAMEAARIKEFEAPEMAKTPAEVAAERAAHLKAQGITETPWDTAAKQTAELQRLMGEQAAERKARREEDTGRKGYREIVANMGAGSFGQSGSAGLRAHYAAEANREAEDQRLRELDYTRQTKLNELNAKAQELRYNEAVGDVAAAQKNRQDLAKLKRDYEKDSTAVANQQATLRERAGAVDATNATTLAAAGIRSGASGVLTPKQIADIRDKAEDNVTNAIKAGGVPMQLALKKDPGLRARMIKDTEDRLLAAYTGGAAPAPVQSQYGPPPQGAVRLKK